MSGAPGPISKRQKVYICTVMFGDDLLTSSYFFFCFRLSAYEFTHWVQMCSSSFYCSFLEILLKFGLYVWLTNFGTLSFPVPFGRSRA